MTSVVNKAGTDWLLLRSHLHTLIKAQQALMEQGLSVEEYHRAVGSITMAREVIEWVEPTAPPQTKEEDYGMLDPNSENYA